MVLFEQKKRDSTIVEPTDITPKLLLPGGDLPPAIAFA